MSMNKKYLSINENYQLIICFPLIIIFIYY